MENPVLYIGEPALLEMCGEECSELAHAALKLARYDRGENPTPVNPEEVIANLMEEAADLLIVLESLADMGTITHEGVESYMIEKKKRWVSRINNHIKNIEVLDLN